MTDMNPIAAPKGRWSLRFSRWSIVLTVIAVLVAAIGLTLARYDVIAKLAGFSAFLGGGLLALVALVFGIIALIAGRNGRLGSKGRLLAAMAVAAVFAGFIATRPMSAGDAPALHDITTDLANPPAFEVLAIRPDNLVGVGSVENWRAMHSRAYADLAPVTIAKPVAAVTADAVRLATAAGWEIAKSDPAKGHVEATASVSYIRFHDDVVIRIVPTEDGKGSRVDMRSISRVGVGDLGVNARRIRDFLKALSAA